MAERKGGTSSAALGTADTRKRVVAVGMFDGMHIGHQAILRETVREAEAAGAAAAILTFSGSMKPAGAGGRIFGEKETKCYAAEYGVGEVLVEEFSSVRRLDCRSFVRTVLIGKLGAESVVVGEDFRFGYRRQGDAELLSELMRESGKSCRILPKQTCDGETVSSTVIREFLRNGQLEKATRWMGHPMTWILPVVAGSHIGRTIGYPTVNQVFPDGRLLPAFGVYAVEADAEGVTREGICNIGIKPTVGGVAPLAETHLLGFSGDLYGKDVQIRLLRYVRPERKFENTDALKAQIAEDIRIAFGEREQ